MSINVVDALKLLIELLPSFSRRIRCVNRCPSGRRIDCYNGLSPNRLLKPREMLRTIVLTGIVALVAATSIVLAPPARAQIGNIFSDPPLRPPGNVHKSKRQQPPPQPAPDDEEEVPELPQGRLLPLPPNSQPPASVLPPPGSVQSQPLAPPPGTSVVPQNPPSGVAIAPPPPGQQQANAPAGQKPPPGSPPPKNVPQTP